MLFRSCQRLDLQHLPEVTWSSFSELGLGSQETTDSNVPHPRDPPHDPRPSAPRLSVQYPQEELAKEGTLAPRPGDVHGNGEEEPGRGPFSHWGRGPRGPAWSPEGTLGERGALPLRAGGALQRGAQEGFSQKRPLAPGDRRVALEGLRRWVAVSMG